MPDTPTPPATPRRSPGPIDQKLLNQLTLDKEIIDDAIAELADPLLATELATHFYDRENTVAITPATLADLSVQAAAALALAGAAINQTATFHDVTADEGDDTATAIAAIRNVQTRAKEKFEETSPAMLDAWLIGQPLKSRQQITTAGTALYGLLRTTDDAGMAVTPQATLPGYTQARIDQFKADLGSYYQAQTDQSGAQEGATAGRDTFKTAAEQVSRRRRKVQLAFDAERPHSPANTALRRRLHLPVDRAMS